MSGQPTDALRERQRAALRERQRAALLQDRLGVMVQASTRGFAIVDYDSLDALAARLSEVEAALRRVSVIGCNGTDSCSCIRCAALAAAQTEGT